MPTVVDRDRIIPINQPGKAAKLQSSQAPAGVLDIRRRLDLSAGRLPTPVYSGMLLRKLMSSRVGPGTARGLRRLSLMPFSKKALTEDVIAPGVGIPCSVRPAEVGAPVGHCAGRLGLCARC